MQNALLPSHPGLRRRLAAFLTKALDPFGERARREEELRALRAVKVAEMRVFALRKAAGYGKPVIDQLIQEQGTLADLRKRIPHGDSHAFCTLLFFASLSGIFLAGLGNLLQQSTVSFYGVSVHWFYVLFNPLSLI